ncbi:AI-2E family transporter [Lacticaseibacillus pabuli]|uniref:AI-2E family transporter n=1 Tax=Lacticaseibacillus pabuli TaxID=3025672 RepID=A0ABY7WTH5_9LACO|nr:AI-2E family transporter [Lacticaseibacillus sp. KACC 23028]WDF82460.1 AI-2E family transporter [Lacticaseibacillus sp. KACC 23028]
MKRESMNRLVEVLLVGVTLLVLAGLVFILSKISFVFSPITTFISTIMGPFLIAGFLYYLLQPLVKLLQKIHVRGRAANVMAFVLLILILGGGLAYLIPQVVTQIASLIGNLPSFMRDAEVWLRDLANSKLAGELHVRDVLKSINLDSSQIASFASKYAGMSAATVGTVVGHIGNALVNIFMAPLVLFYFMKDGGKLSGSIQRFVSPRWREFVANLLGKMNSTMESYFSGQFMDMLIVGLLSCIGYAISGTPYALIIGITAGIMNMVPYIGPWLGAVPAVLVAMTVSWTQVILAIIVAVAVQQIDNNFVYPNVIGKSMEIHPLTVLVLLLTAGNMFGLLGVILGIPAYAVAKTALKCMVDEPRLHFFSWMRKPAPDAATPDAATPDTKAPKTDQPK